MITSKLTTKSQTTIPKKVRESLDLHPEDAISYIIEEDHAIIHKVTLQDAAYLKALESTLEEWASEEDSEAYDNL